MNNLSLLLITLISVLIISLSVSINNNIEDRDTIKRITNNFNNIQKENKELSFKTVELKNYLKIKDTAHKKELDSVLKEHKVKIRQLKKYQKIVITTIDLDTSVVNFKDTIQIMDSLYVLPFIRSKNCVYVSGRVISKDNNTKLFLDTIKNENILYQTISYKKTFWDWLFGREGKEVVKVSSKCGSVENSELEVIE